jgi:hypothetical protein
MPTTSLDKLAEALSDKLKDAGNDTENSDGSQCNNEEEWSLVLQETTVSGHCTTMPLRRSFLTRPGCFRPSNDAEPRPRAGWGNQ